MFDLKPSAPSGVRSEFRPIATSATGVQIGECLPRLAKWMHRAALIRSVNHKAGCHNPLPSYTGSEQALPDIISTNDNYPPSMGAVCEWLRQNGGGKRKVDLPDYVYMPCYLGWGQAIHRPGPYAGFLGKQYDALYTECSPYLDKGKTCLPGQPQYVRGQPRLPNAALETDITLDRLKERRTLLEQFERKLPRARGGCGAVGIQPAAESRLPVADVGGRARGVRCREGIAGPARQVRPHPVRVQHADRAG